MLWYEVVKIPFFLSIMEKDFEFLKQVGSAIRAKRKGKGISIENLAYKIDMSFSQLARIERGEINTTIQSLKNIADGLEITLYEIFEEI